jgi:hypothetical protein
MDDCNVHVALSLSHVPYAPSGLGFGVTTIGTRSMQDMDVHVRPVRCKHKRFYTSAHIRRLKIHHETRSGTFHQLEPLYMISRI